MVKFAILNKTVIREIKINDQVITESNQPLPEKTADNTCSACSGTLYVDAAAPKAMEQIMRMLIVPTAAEQVPPYANLQC